MKFPRRAFGVPLHPLLVHFPIAFWLLTPALDIATLAAGADPWWALAQGATILGLVFGAAAIAVGLLEYSEPSLAGIDMRLAARHGARTSLAWGVFAGKLIATAFLPLTTGTMALYLAVDLIGCALLVHGVYLGTRQVYEQLEKDN